MRFILLAFTLYSSLLAEEFFKTSLLEVEQNIVVDLRNPQYEEGVLQTEEGGILTAPHFRVQAQRLVYTRYLEADPPIFTVQCEGNLLIDYQQWVLVGDYLYYDFITHTGFLINGKTANPPWYVGGNEVLLLNSGDLIALDSYLTTSEGEKPDIMIRSTQITLSPHNIVTANNLNFWIRKLPLFWFPKMKVDLNHKQSSPFSVKFGWGGFLGSHLSLLYRFLSWGDFKGIARLDGFFNHGIGAGIETHYNPKSELARWYTRSYYAHDIAIDDPRKKDRYRLQGTFYDCIQDVNIYGVYDYVSDAQMAADFNIKDFDLPTAGRTQLDLKKQESDWIANLITRVRINDFQSINQELPTFFFHLHPFEIPYTGILVENTFRASYLDYVFSDDVINGVDFHSARVFTYPRFYRPFFFGPFTATPEVGFIGIGYTNSPSSGSVGQAIGEIGFQFNTSFSRQGSWFKHVVEPHIHYHYLTQPRVSVNNHFIFTIQDGYDRLNLLRFGLINSFFIKAPCACSPPLWLDLWANAFFNETTISKAIPKFYLNIEWQPYNRLFIETNGGWNLKEGLLDYSNTRIDWTFNHNFALGLEYRHRSRFDWRKANFYNFTLETVRTQSALLTSPLSDRRNTLLLRTFIRLNPNWTAKFDVRHGWDRPKQPSYFEYQVEIGTILFQHWCVQFIYDKQEADNRYGIFLKLNSGPPL